MRLSSLMKGLVGFWPLDAESMKSSVIFGDKTPYSGDGVSANVPNFVADRFGNTRAMSFNGTTDVVRIPDSASLSPTSAMTAMVWVKGAAQIGRGIFSHYDLASQRSFLLHTGTTDVFRVYISDDGSLDVGHSKEYNSSITALDNTWHLIGFSFDAGTLKLYIDGVEDTNPTKTYDDAITTIHDSTADVMLGCYLNLDTPTVFFNGSIAEPRIYNRVLSAVEITSLAEQYMSKVMI